MSDALSRIPDNEPFLLIWCDLILADEHELPDTDKNVVGISQGFSCRWSYRDGKFLEEPSDNHGVAGYFIFQNKNLIADVPASGEFVRWLKKKNFAFDEQPLTHHRRTGTRTCQKRNRLVQKNSSLELR